MNKIDSFYTKVLKEQYNWNEQQLKKLKSSEISSYMQNTPFKDIPFDSNLFKGDAFQNIIDIYLQEVLQFIPSKYLSSSKVGNFHVRILPTGFVTANIKKIPETNDYIIFIDRSVFFATNDIARFAILSYIYFSHDKSYINFLQKKDIYREKQILLLKYQAVIKNYQDTSEYKTGKLKEEIHKEGLTSCLYAGFMQEIMMKFIIAHEISHVLLEHFEELNLSLENTAIPKELSSIINFEKEISADTLATKIIFRLGYYRMSKAESKSTILMLSDAMLLSPLFVFIMIGVLNEHNKEGLYSFYNKMNTKEIFHPHTKDRIKYLLISYHKMVSKYKKSRFLRFFLKRIIKNKIKNIYKKHNVKSNYSFNEINIEDIYKHFHNLSYLWIELVPDYKDIENHNDFPELLENINQILKKFEGK